MNNATLHAAAFYYQPTIWDALLVIPIVLIASMTAAALVQVLATPRIFRRPSRRIPAALALVAYALLILGAGPEAAGGRWQADVWLVLRSFAQAIPNVVLLMVLRRLEMVHCERPLKGPFWKTA